MGMYGKCLSAQGQEEMIIKIKAIETVITPNCQKVHGVSGAVDIALKKIKERLLQCITSFPEGTYSIEVFRIKEG